MLEFMLCVTSLWIIVTCWPVENEPVGGLALMVAVFLAAPLGWLLIHTPVAMAGWALWAMAGWVLARWMHEKWNA